MHIQNTADMINNIEITIKFKIFNKVRLKIIVKIVITKLTIVKMKNVLKTNTRRLATSSRLANWLKLILSVPICVTVF